MSAFLSNIIHRHQQTVPVVHPRSKSRFETYPQSTILPVIPFERERVVPDRTDGNISDNPAVSIDPTDLHQQDLDPISTVEVSQPEVATNPRMFKPDNGKSERPNPVIPNPFVEIKNKEAPDRSNAAQEKTALSKGLLKQNNDVLRLAEITKPPLNETPRLTPVTERDEHSSPDKQQSLKQQKLPPTLNQLLINQVVKPGGTYVLPNPPSTIFSKENAVVNHQRNQYTPAPASTIKIHIGRIDIKAVKPPPAKPAKVKKAHQPEMSLQQFLKKRESKPS